MKSLTRPQPCGDTGRSLKNTSSTPAPLLRSRVFCTPHSARRASARRARSMGVSGIRKDPDALVCVESTPTPFRVVVSISKSQGGIMPNTSIVAFTAAHSFFPCNPDQTALLSVNPGVEVCDALEQALSFIGSARRIGMQVCENLEHAPGCELLYPMLDLMRLVEGIMYALDNGMSALNGRHDMRYFNLLERIGELFDGLSLIVNPEISAAAAKDAAQFVEWVRAQRQGGEQ